MDNNTNLKQISSGDYDVHENDGVADNKPSVLIEDLR